jgi:hypothetical protein
MRPNVVMPMDQAGSDVKIECHGTSKPWNKRNILRDKKDKQNQDWTNKKLIGTQRSPTGSKTKSKCIYNWWEKKK